MTRAELLKLKLDMVYRNKSREEARALFTAPPSAASGAAAAAASS
jgi:hypothetical protein